MPHSLSTCIWFDKNAKEAYNFYQNIFKDVELISENPWSKKYGSCADKFGVHWQVVPSILGKYMTNPETAPKATYAFLQMSKFIITDLEKAAED